MSSRSVENHVWGSTYSSILKCAVPIMFHNSNKISIFTSLSRHLNTASQIDRYNATGLYQVDYVLMVFN